MAAPIADKVILPLDTGNTGKKVRTQTRVVGADTVHEHYFVPASVRENKGFYHVHSGVLTIPTSAHNGTTSGHLFLFNPIGSTVKAAVSRIRSNWQMVAGAIDLTVPRQLYSRFTYTGTPSGASLTPAKRRTSDANAQVNVRTAMTGMTISLVATIRSSLLPPIIVTASSATIQVVLPVNPVEEWDIAEAEQIELVAGEGIVLWSADASTTANRRMVTDIIWEEFE